MATHSSILAWRIPWTEEPGGLQSLGSQESDTTERLSTCIPVMHSVSFKRHACSHASSSAPHHRVHANFIPFYIYSSLLRQLEN